MSKYSRQLWRGLVASSALLIGLVACTRTTETIEPGFSETTCQYFFYKVRDVNSVRCTAFGATEPWDLGMLGGQIGARTLIAVYAEGVDHSRQSPIPATSHYKHALDSIGDGRYNGSIRYDTLIFSSGIKGLKLTALTDYNADYPAGSDLAPIARVVHWVYQPVDTPSTGQRIYSERERLSALTAPLDIHLPTCDLRTQAQDRWGVISLEEAPTDPNQRMRLQLELMNGKVFETEFAITIAEF